MRAVEGVYWDKAKQREGNVENCYKPQNPPDIYNGVQAEIAQQMYEICVQNIGGNCKSHARYDISQKRYYENQQHGLFTVFKGIGHKAHGAGPAIAKDNQKNTAQNIHMLQRIWHKPSLSFNICVAQLVRNKAFCIFVQSDGDDDAGNGNQDAC